jgi:hypothetical protein
VALLLSMLLFPAPPCDAPVPVLLPLAVLAPEVEPEIDLVPQFRPVIDSREAWRRWRSAVRAVCWLEKNAWQFPDRADDYKRMLAYQRGQRAAYDALADCLPENERCPNHLSFLWARSERLREVLGDGDFYLGVLPPWVELEVGE